MRKNKRTEKSIVVSQNWIHLVVPPPTFLSGSTPLSRIKQERSYCRSKRTARCVYVYNPASPWRHTINVTLVINLSYAEIWLFADVNASRCEDSKLVIPDKLAGHFQKCFSNVFLFYFTNVRNICKKMFCAKTYAGCFKSIKTFLLYFTWCDRFLSSSGAQ